MDKIVFFLSEYYRIEQQNIVRIIIKMYLGVDNFFFFLRWKRFLDLFIWYINKLKLGLRMQCSLVECLLFYQVLGIRFSNIVYIC